MLNKIIEERPLQVSKSLHAQKRHVEMNDKSLEFPPVCENPDELRAAFVKHFKQRMQATDDYCNGKKKFEYVTKRDKKAAVAQAPLVTIVQHTNNVMKRSKYLILEDQRKSVLDWELNRNHRAAGKLSCRNPFKIDDSLINYMLDSEDEWAEENAEDLENDDKKGGSDEEDEEMDDDGSNAGFIVDDGYLSVCEMLDSEGEEDFDTELSRARLEERRRLLMQRQKDRQEKKREMHLQQLRNGP